ncbi:MAG: type II secretion system F family protein [Actinomycetota bacterium]|nr:type II secretion system F family protein [Actinomycetota bacterium]
MVDYFIILSYYLFTCMGLFYFIRNTIKNRKYVCGGKSSYFTKDGKAAGGLISKIDLLSFKIGSFFINKKHFRSMKKNAELLKLLEYESKVFIKPESFIGYRIILLVLFTIAGLFIGSGPLSSIVTGLLCGVAGYLIPALLLRNFSRKRQNEINMDLPDIIDLLVVATLSGQNIYNAIKIVIEKYEGSICSELSNFIKDVDIGLGKMKAYKNLMDRSDSDEFKNFVFTLIQAEKYGTSIIDILKRKSDYIKFEAYQGLEGKIRKKTVVIIFPLVFLILPAFIILAGGPLIYLMGGSFPGF